MSTYIRIVLVLINFFKKPVSDALVSVGNIITNMTGNANFTSPTPPIATITTQRDELQEAAEIAKTGNKQERAAVKPKLRILKSSVKQLAGYVETIANANPETAEEVALSSGFPIKRLTPRGKRVFTAENTAIAGTVKVYTGTVKKAIAYEFDYTQTPETDTSWIPTETKASATRIVPGLTSGKTYYFRYRVIFRSGPGDWSDNITLVVM